MIDLSTEFGQRVQRRLKGEQIVWLTTVAGSDKPYTRPVWFLWQVDEILLFSQPETFKLKHIQHNPQAALNFDSDGRGGDIIVFTGTARIDSAHPPADQVVDFINKYEGGLQRIGMTPAAFADSYSVAVRVKLESLSGH